MTDHTAQHQPALAAPFEALRRRLRRRHLAAAAIAALAVLVAVVFLVEALDSLRPWRESWAFRAVGVGLALGLVVLVRGVFQALWRGPSARALALEIERARPEFLDALVCAVELEAAPPRPMNPVEQALLAQVRAQVAGRVPLTPALSAALRWRRLILPAVLFAACMGVGLHTRAWQKAMGHAGDRRRGESTGLRLRAPSGPVPEHSDVRLEVDVQRWEPEADLEYRDDQGRHRYRMNRGEGRSSFFTLYGVTGTVRYRVVTPSLATPWRTLETYRPPSFEAVSFRVVSPSYTRRAVQDVDGFRDLRAVVGSRVEMRVQTQPGVAVELRGEGAPEAFAVTPEGAATHAVVAEGDRSFRLALRSPAGWEAMGQDQRLVVQPDLPPVLSVLQPERDAQAGVETVLPVAARAADDFGLERVVLTWAVSGGERQSRVLFEAAGAAVLDRAVESAFDVAALQAQPGDVISYSLSAVDNREPVPQETRSEVGFIVVRPKFEPKDQEGNPGEQKKLDIGPLIAESKRLIRVTWDAVALPAAARPDAGAALHRDLLALRLEVHRVFVEIMQASNGQVAGSLPTYFAQAEQEIASAGGIVEAGRLAESQAPQERALAALIHIENELLENAVRAQGQEGQGDQESPPPESPAESKASQRQVLEALRQARQRTQELAERQARLNRDLQNAAGVPPEAIAGLAQKQDGVAGDTAALARDLEALEEARRAAQSLVAGAGEMQQGVGRLKGQDVAGGEQHGRRAGGLLEAAVRDLDEAIRRAAAERLRSLATAAERLSAAQREAASASRDLAGQPSAPPSAHEAAEQRQRQLNQAAADLRSAVDRTAGELEGTYPETSEALSKAMAQAARQGLDRAMSRAANALLYRRPERAVKPQTDAANWLLELAQGLEAAATTLPALSREELAEALEALQQQSRQTAQAMQQPEAEGQARLEAIRERAAGTLRPLAAALKDPVLQEIADRMGGDLGGSTAAEVGGEMQGLFRAAIRVLEGHVMAAEVRRRLDLSRRTSVPPEKYRREVEAYFRDLGREP